MPLSGTFTFSSIERIQLLTGVTLFLSHVVDDFLVVEIGLDMIELVVQQCERLLLERDSDF
jgi:hypothetical protein